jgi:hypothetical protein
VHPPVRGDATGFELVVLHSIEIFSIFFSLPVGAMMLHVMSKTRDGKLRGNQTLYSDVPSIQAVNDIGPRAKSSRHIDEGIERVTCQSRLHTIGQEGLEPVW